MKQQIPMQRSMMAVPKILGHIRNFFRKKRIPEVITPLLQSTIPTEPCIYPFTTNWRTISGERKLFLATSPEAGLKQILASGINDCYTVAHAFRNLESSGDRHLPEFLMLEWYRKNKTYKDSMVEVRELILFIAEQEKITHIPTNTWKTYALPDLWKQYVGNNLLDVLDEEQMKRTAEKRGYSTQNASWEQLFHQIFLNEIDTHIGNAPCYLTDFPKKISPLCAGQKLQPHIAERFELYIDGMEIANGNTENTNYVEIRKIFLDEEKYRKKHQLPFSSIDQKFLDALNGMKGTYAGVGMGIERLAMVFTKTQDIQTIEPLFEK